MTAVSRKPRLFIASSTEQRAIAFAIQENLDFDADCTVWTQGIFTPTRQALLSLVELTTSIDFAAFVLTPDDFARVRGLDHDVVRDNVIFELGLFMGRLGIHSCFMVTPRPVGQVHLPSDLLGLEPLSYEARRGDGNLLAALGSPCNAIRRTMGKLSISSRNDMRAPSRTETAGQKLDRLLSEWSGAKMSQDRAMLRAGVPLWVGEDETGEATAAIKRIFALLNSVAQLVLDHPEIGPLARLQFEQPARSVWALARSFFVSPSATADEAWGSEPPALAALVAHWQENACNSA